MKKNDWIACFLFAIFSVYLYSQPVRNAQNRFEVSHNIQKMLESKHEADTIILRFHNGITEEIKAYFWQTLQVISVEKLEIVSNAYIVKLPTSSNLADSMNWLYASSEIMYAEPNYIVDFHQSSNDPYFIENSLWGLLKIQAPSAWELWRNSDTIVAILDSGADPTHEDLRDNIWQNDKEKIGKPGVDDDKNGYIDDIQGWSTVTNSGDIADDVYHGSHVAGIAGAKGNNSVGVVGVCWTVPLMIVKVGSTSGISFANATKGLEYALKNGAKICNLSFGGATFSQIMYDAITTLQQNGIICVCAAGNISINLDVIPLYPAAYDHDNIVTVAGSNQNDVKHTTSAYGPNSVDIFAPGVGIWSTVPPTLNGGNPYRQVNGTSMATPCVSGCLSLLWTKYPYLNYHEIIAKILRTVDSVVDGANQVKSGGRINLQNALLESEEFELKGNGGCLGTVHPNSFSFYSMLNGILPYLVLFVFFYQRRRYYILNRKYVMIRFQ